MTDQETEKLLENYGPDIAASNVSNASESKPQDEIKTRARARTNSICSSITENEKKEAAFQAIKNFENPIKVTFKNLSFSVKVPTTKLERKQRPEKTKELEILK